MTRGPSAWQELLQTERDIRVKRQKAIYAQEEARARFFEWLMIVGMSAALLLLIGGVAWLVGIDRGLW